MVYQETVPCDFKKRGRCHMRSDWISGRLLCSTVTIASVVGVTCDLIGSVDDFCAI